MAHRMGFSRDSLGQALTEAGFAEAWVSCGNAFDLWAIGLMPGADRAYVDRQLIAAGVRFFGADGAVA